MSNEAGGVMEFSQFVEWGFQGMLLGAVGLGIKEMGKLRVSIESLNVTVAKAMTRLDGHDQRNDRQDERLDQHDERIRALEIKK